MSYDKIMQTGPKSATLEAVGKRLSYELTEFARYVIDALPHPS